MFVIFAFLLIMLFAAYGLFGCFCYQGLCQYKAAISEDGHVPFKLRAYYALVSILWLPASACVAGEAVVFAMLDVAAGYGDGDGAEEEKLEV